LLSPPSTCCRRSNHRHRLRRRSRSRSPRCVGAVDPTAAIVSGGVRAPVRRGSSRPRCREGVGQRGAQVCSGSAMAAMVGCSPWCATRAPLPGECGQRGGARPLRLSNGGHGGAWSMVRYEGGYAGVRLQQAGDRAARR
jgi:hypothetical protein